MENFKKNMSLNIVLMLVSLVIMAMGVNVGFGGIPTLGWFGGGEFTVVAGEAAYDVQDNHIRFLGGVWFALGLVFLWGAFRLDKLRTILIIFCLIIAVGGLFRISAMDFELIFGAAIAPSFALELIGFPLLAVWLLRTNRLASL